MLRAQRTLVRQHGARIARSHAAAPALQLPRSLHACCVQAHSAHAGSGGHSRSYTNTSSRSSRGTGRFALVCGAGLALLASAAALISSPLEAAAEKQPPPRQPPTPAWLGERVCEAAAVGDLDKLQSLLSKHQPREGVNITHKFGWTPLHVAVANGHTHVVRWLLSQPEIDVNKADRYNPRARNLDAMVVKHSARQDAFPELYPQVPADGFTALHYAALFAPLEVIDMLIDAGADLDATAHGHTADRLLDFGAATEDGGEIASEQAGLQEKRARMQAVGEKMEAAREKRRDQRARQDKEERLKFPLELKLAKEVIAQELPILSVAAAIRRRENGWFDSSKPLVFLFLGSSGVRDIHFILTHVGKTMLAKLLAAHVLKDPEAFIRIDCSEYQQKHEMSRLIGSPPGYVGHEEGGQLTTKLAKRPNAIVLLDEVEKAHPDVLTLLLQTFDEGRLTDGKGNTVACPNAIFVMTSNLVQEEIRDAIENGYELRPRVSILADLARSTEQLRALGGITSTPLQTSGSATPKQSQQPDSEKASAPSGSAGGALVPVPPVPSGTILPGAVPAASGSSTSSDRVAKSMAKLATDTERFLRFIVHPILKRAFHRDEFIGRINDIIVFHPFSADDLRATVQAELTRWAARARERHQIDLSWTPAVVDSLTHNYDERYGYRSIMYGVEKRVVNVLASAHERDAISAGCKVVLDVGDGAAADADATEHAHQQAPIVIKEVIQPKAHERKKFLGIF